MKGFSNFLLICGVSPPSLHNAGEQGTWDRAPWRQGPGTACDPHRSVEPVRRRRRRGLERSSPTRGVGVGRESFLI